MSSAAAAIVGPTSTPTSIAPSPSHFATRTPRRVASSRVSARKLLNASMAACSPLVAMNFVKPHRSMNANAPLDERDRVGELAGCSVPLTVGAVPIAP